MTELTVNGVKHTVSGSTTVTQLLETLKIVPERVVVELNLTILKRVEHASTVLKDGDQVEIVHFVGGGAIARAGRFYFRDRDARSENRNVPGNSG
ncbi:MAG: sulfur carrier protein ThiS [Candidatus Omnitrophica bacterium]|nr:sulfur carrier protein ThiS [Candidatus Omnitrophota bacterium]